MNHAVESHRRNEGECCCARHGCEAPAAFSATRCGDKVARSGASSVKRISCSWGRKAVGPIGPTHTGMERSLPVVGYRSIMAGDASKAAVQRAAAFDRPGAATAVPARLPRVRCPPRPFQRPAQAVTTYFR